MALTVYSVQILNSKEVKLTVQEMRDGASYELAVSNVQDINGNTIDPANATQEFLGVGVRPQVVSASYVDITHIDVLFSEAMADDVNFVNVANYAVSGQSSPGVHEVIRSVDGLTAHLELDADMQTGTYNVAVQNISDLGGNLLDGDYDNDSFDAHIKPWRDHATLENGLLAHYKLEGNGNDASDNAYHGNFNGTTPDTITGKVGSGLSFESYEYVTIPSPEAFDTMNAFSMVAWIKIHTVAATYWHTIMGRKYQAYFSVISADTYIAHLFAGIYTAPTTSSSCIGSTHIVDDTWTHVALTFDGGTSIKFYVNGEAAGTSTVPAGGLACEDTATPITLGVIKNVTSKDGNEALNSPLLGDLDECTFHNRELTLAEIQYLYNAGAGRAF